jgi:biopolymer transport protein ExbD
MRYVALLAVLLAACEKKPAEVREKGDAAETVPLDMPKSARSGDIGSTFTVFLVADGTTIIDGKAVGNDNAIQPFAHRAYERDPELRAVIKADPAVTHARVLHVIDELKAAGISKIAFGVETREATIPSPAPTPPAPSR